MAESQRRIQRIAVGLAVAAVLVALSAVVVVATRRPDAPTGAPRTAHPASRHVSADDLAKLTPETLRYAGDGVHVIDDALRTSLGLARADKIVAISGLRVTSAAQLPRMLRDLGALTPTSLFVDLVRDREPVLERWKLDGDLDPTRRADADHGTSSQPRPSASPPLHPPLDPLIGTIRRIDSSTYDVPRATVEAWSAQPVRIAAGGATALSDTGGLRIFGVRPGSIPEALGIRNGDLIRGINGAELGSLDKALEIIAKSTQRLTVDLRRGNQTILLNYLIK